MAKASIPYANATSGVAARTEITNILRRFGCSNVGFMDDYQNHEVLLAFEHRGNRVQLRASAKGWAAMFLKAEPWTPQRRSTRQQILQNSPRDCSIGDEMSEHNPCVMTIVVSKATLARLRAAAAEMGQADDYVWQIASDAVDEAALNAFRHRDDDPGRAISKAENTNG